MVLKLQPHSFPIQRERARTLLWIDISATSIELFPFFQAASQEAKPSTISWEQS